MTLQRCQACIDACLQSVADLQAVIARFWACLQRDDLPVIDEVSAGSTWVCAAVCIAAAQLMSLGRQTKWCLPAGNVLI